MDARPHPKGLYVIFFTETWDRLSFYGLQAILILYLTNKFHFANQLTYTIYGTFGTLAFCAPIIGGFLAGRYLDYKRCIIYGIILVICGNFILSLNTLSTLYLGLTLAIIGIGLFKANNASLLGTLYQTHNSKQEVGFTIFYMGMNIGAILGPLVFGFIAQHYGWHYVFLFSGLGITSGLIVFILKKHYFQALSTSTKGYYANYQKDLFLILGIVLTSIFLLFLLKHPTIFSKLLFLIAGIVLIYFLVISYQYDTEQRHKILLIILLNIFSTFYFACSLQIGSSLMLFISQHVDTTVAGWKIPAATFASLDPFFVIVSTPLLAPLWRILDNRQRTPSVIIRVILGLLLAAISFTLFAAVANLPSTKHMMIMTLIVLGNFTLGAGELCIGPALLSAVTYMIPKSLQSTFMGFWYLAIAFSAYLASFLAKLSASPVQITASSSTIGFVHEFEKTAVLALLAAIFVIILAPTFKKMSGTVQFAV